MFTEFLQDFSQTEYIIFYKVDMNINGTGNMLAE
jgi:hypothetical protein